MYIPYEPSSTLSSRSPQEYLFLIQHISLAANVYHSLLYQAVSNLGSNNKSILMIQVYSSCLFHCKRLNPNYTQTLYVEQNTKLLPDIWLGLLVTFPISSWPSNQVYLFLNWIVGLPWSYYVSSLSAWQTFSSSLFWSDPQSNT